MSAPAIRFYQTGSFAVGNRLLDPEQRSVQADEQRTNSITCGHRACQGCGEALGARYALDAAMRATNGQMIAANATGCLEVFSTPYPESSWRIPWIHSLFANAPAVSTGIAAALRAKGREDVRVVGQGGDGGTVDIGFACLSGMFERNDDVLYICYDNEAYMNTGVQRSGLHAARGAHGHDPGRRPRARERVRPGQERAADRDGARDPLRRDGHRRRAARPRGEGPDGDGDPRRALPARLRPLPARLGQRLQGHDPRSRGWRRSPASSRCSRRATARSRASSKIRRQVPVEDYLRPQKRFAHLFAPEPRSEVIARIQAGAERNIRRFGLLGDEARRSWLGRHGRRGGGADGQAVRDHAGRRLEPGEQDRLLARGAPASTCTACRRATTPARPARTSSSGSTTPSPATTRRPGASSSRTTRCRR